MIDFSLINLIKLTRVLKARPIEKKTVMMGEIQKYFSVSGNISLEIRRGVRSYVQCGCNVLAKF